MHDMRLQTHRRAASQLLDMWRSLGRLPVRAITTCCEWLKGKQAGEQSSFNHDIIIVFIIISIAQISRKRAMSGLSPVRELLESERHPPVFDSPNKLLPQGNPPPPSSQGFKFRSEARQREPGRGAGARGVLHQGAVFLLFCLGWDGFEEPNIGSFGLRMRDIDPSCELLRIEC